MKIGQICHVYPPHTGGLENYVYRLTQYLEKDGYDVIVYTTDFEINNIDKKQNNVFFGSSIFSLLRNPLSIDTIRYLLKSDCDIYHIHGYEFFQSLIATILLKNKKKILTQHGAKIEDLTTGILLLNVVYYPFARFILKNMERIIVLGNSDKEYLKTQFHVPENKITVIPNGIEFEKFHSNEKTCNEFVKTHNLNPDSFKILFVGRLIRTKNAHKLIQSVQYLTKHLNIEIIIIGDGDKRYINELKQNNDPRIHILEKVDFDYLVAAYSISHLFVMLGEWSEGLPTVLLEAMACGLPVLTTKSGNIEEVIIENENGIFLDSPIDEKILAEKIEFFINSDTSKMKENNVRKIKTTYDWYQLVKKIEEEYEKIIISN